MMGPSTFLGEGFYNGGVLFINHLHYKTAVLVWGNNKQPAFEFVCVVLCWLVCWFLYL